MGFFSWECHGCDKSLLSPMRGVGTKFSWMQQVVVLDRNAASDDKPCIGEYDGYGRVNGLSMHEESPCVWHYNCWLAAGKPAYTSESRHSSDQGWFFEDKDYETVKNPMENIVLTGGSHLLPNGEWKKNE